MKRLISKDNFTGVSTYYHSHGDGRFSIESVQDIEPTLEFNKTEANSGWDGYMSKEKNLRKVAHIPNVVLIKLMHQGINPFDKNDRGYLKRWLNDIDNRYMRTHYGRL